MRISDWSSDVCSSDLFDRLGTAIELADESAFDIFTAASATMASYFAFAHSIAAWMQRHGTDAAQARLFVAQLLKSLGETATIAPQAGFAALADAHPTRGGINEQVFRPVSSDGVIEDRSEARRVGQACVRTCRPRR